MRTTRISISGFDPCFAGALSQEPVGTAANRDSWTPSQERKGTQAPRQTQPGAAAEGRGATRLASNRTGANPPYGMIRGGGGNEVDGLMTFCHDARKGGYIGSHWLNHVRASALLDHSFNISVVIPLQKRTVGAKLGDQEMKFYFFEDDEADTIQQPAPSRRSKIAGCGCLLIAALAVISFVVQIRYSGDNTSASAYKVFKARVTTTHNSLKIVNKDTFAWEAFCVVIKCGRPLVDYNAYVAYLRAGEARELHEMEFINASGEHLPFSGHLAVVWVNLGVLRGLETR